MPIEATELWSEHQYKPGVSAQRGMLVTGATNVDQAIMACAALNASRGASYLRDRDLIADAPDVSTPDGPALYHVLWHYKPREQLSPGEEQNGGVDRRPIFEWEPNLSEEQADRTATKKPIVNSVGDVFDPPLSKLVPSMFLNFTRWESAYDVQVAMRYMGTKNSNRLSIHTLAGDLLILPGQMLCHSIRPAQPYRSTTRTVPVTYRFEFRETFKRRVLNTGFNAWYRHGTRPIALGRICNAAGEPITGPVRLDKEGKPINTKLKVLVQGTSKTTANPEAAPAQNLPALDFDPDSGPDAVWILFDMIPDADFSGLGL